MPLLANINVGTNPNDGTGDSIRDSFIIVNENFQFIESFFPNTDVVNLTANITSSGNSSFNNVSITGTTTSSGNISGSYFSGNGSLLTGVVATGGLAGYVTGNAQGNITSVGTLTGLTLSGTLTGTTINGAVIGNSTATIIGTLGTNAQPNITSVGTLDNVLVSGTGNLYTGIIQNTLYATNISSGAMVLDRITNIRKNYYYGFNVANITTLSVNITGNISSVRSFDCNANITLSYTNIIEGYSSTVYIRNKHSANANIILPNSNNNKATNVVIVGSNVVAKIDFFAFGNDSANVFATITSN